MKKDVLLSERGAISFSQELTGNFKLKKLNFREVKNVF